MLRIAIVEDDEKYADLLQEYLKKYGEERSEEFCCVVHKNAVVFLNNYKANYDIVFMDIDLPHMNGMTASQKLREVDKQVVLVFVTNLAQMAIKGYEVNAYDFIVKPVSYYDFSMKLNKIRRYLSTRVSDEISIAIGKGIVRVMTSLITYIEVLDHKLIFHTEEQDYVSYGSLNKLETNPKMKNFARCNACYLVNLQHVRKVEGYTVFLGSAELSISHPRRAAFLKRLSEYLGTVT